jgi:hypothetical protein
VSLDAVKKSWRAIYERVDTVAPRLLGARVVTGEVPHRHAERRRHLLDYLRTHLEELRPVASQRSHVHAGAGLSRRVARDVAPPGGVEG